MSVAESYKHAKIFMVLSFVLKSYLLYLRVEICPFIIEINLTFTYADFFSDFKLSVYYNSVYIKT